MRRLVEVAFDVTFDILALHFEVSMCILLIFLRNTHVIPQFKRFSRYWGIARIINPIIMTESSSSMADNGRLDN